MNERALAKRVHGIQMLLWDGRNVLVEPVKPRPLRLGEPVVKSLDEFPFEALDRHAKPATHVASVKPPHLVHVLGSPP